MSSKYWNEKVAERYRSFRYEFEERRLAGKCVIVAGATGGLGAALVALLSREGARVIVGYRANRARAESLAAAMREQFGAELRFVEGDIASVEVRKRYVETARGLGAPLAGAAILPGDAARVKVEDLELGALEESLRVNFSGPALLARDLGGAMEASRGGSIVLLATMQALAPFAGSLNYAAPKAALVHAGKILAQQWKRVRVNVVAPGATVAGMAEASVSSGKYDAFIESGVIPRFGRPEDVARAVRYLLEPDGYENGQVLAVDGGLTIRK